MARGKKTNDAMREKIIAAYNAGESMGDIAKSFKIGKSTVSGIIKKYEEERPDEVEHLRMEKRIEYIEGTKAVLQSLLSILERRTVKLIEEEDKLDDILDFIDDCDMSDKKKIQLSGKISSLMAPKLTELTTAFGTLYDKLERMNVDNPEENGGGVVEVSATVKINPPSEDSYIEEPDNE